MISPRKDSPLFLTTGYIYTESIDNFSDSTFNTVASSNPYIGVSILLWPSNMVSAIVGAFYSPASKASVGTALGTEEWTGSGVSGKTALSFSLSDSWKFQVSILYISQQFTSKTSGAATTKTSFSQNYFFPSAGIALAF
jgi:hypothetical protein